MHLSATVVCLVSYEHEDLLALSAWPGSFTTSISSPPRLLLRSTGTVDYQGLASPEPLKP